MDTKTKILEAARKQARTLGLYNMRRADVARAAGVATGTVSFHFTDMNGLRAALIEKAKGGAPQYLGILAEALTARDPRATKAPAEIKRAALNTAA